MLRILFIPLTVNSWFKNKQTNQPQKKQTKKHYQPVLLHAVSDDTREKSTDCEITANRLPWKQLCFPPFCFLWSKTGLIALVHDTPRWIIPGHAESQLCSPREQIRSCGSGGETKAEAASQWSLSLMHSESTDAHLQACCYRNSVYFTHTLHNKNCYYNNESTRLCCGAFFAGKKQPMPKQEP